MSGFTHRRKQSSLRIKVQIPQNCLIVIFAGTFFPPANDILSLSTTFRFADLTDFEFFLDPLDTSVFPGIPSGVECHSGFANKQAKYVALVSLSTSYANENDARKDRIDYPPLRQKYALVARCLAGHRRRPFSRCGARPP